MSKRAKELAERFTAFNNEVISQVENCSDKEWRKVCSDEGWPFGVVARHIAAGHYGALDLAKMIVAAEPLPDLTMEAIDRMNDQHAQKHADCTKAAVLDLLHQNGSSFASYVAGLSDSDLEQTGHLSAIGGDISTQKFIEYVILDSGAEHLASMKRATGS